MGDQCTYAGNTLGMAILVQTMVKNRDTNALATNWQISSFHLHLQPLGAHFVRIGP